MPLSGHAWIIRGGAPDVASVRSLLSEAGITVAPVDVWMQEYGTFGIDDAHEVGMRAVTRGIEGQRLFIIVATQMTNEAQNAFLKTLEEPKAECLFVLLVPQPHMLLATVRSRAHIVELPARHVQTSTIDAKEFLSARPADRLELLKPLITKKDDEGYNVVAIAAFVDALERYIATIPDNQLRAECVRELYHCRRYVGDRGALVKVILEGLALLLPVV